MDLKSQNYSNMNNDKEELFFKKRLLDSAQLAYRKEIVVYSDFLGLAEQNLFYTALREFPPIGYSCYGGTGDAERFCIRFDGTKNFAALTQLPLDEEEAFPVACIEITPSALKFSDTLTHRDFLGALMHLGITRAKLGDIYVKSNTAYLFCADSIAEFICNELFQIKHTTVHCELVTPEAELFAPEFKEISCTVASLRLDACVAAAFQSSRGTTSGYIDAGKTYVNGKLSLKAGLQLEEGDIVSVRGLGRFFIAEIRNQTKKGRTAILIKKYIS